MDEGEAMYRRPMCGSISSSSWQDEMKKALQKNDPWHLQTAGVDKYVASNTANFTTASSRTRLLAWIS